MQSMEILILSKLSRLEGTGYPLSKSVSTAEMDEVVQVCPCPERIKASTIDQNKTDLSIK